MAYDLRTNFGATGNGVDNDLQAWKDANAQIKSDGGGRLVIPFGTYAVTRDGSAPRRVQWDAPNTVFEWDPGARLLAIPDPSTAQVSTFRFHPDAKNCRWTGGIIDGNWGAITGVTDSRDGINFGTQTDPKSHGLSIWGAQGLRIYGLEVVQTYGDLIWIGASDHDNNPNTPAIPVRDVVIHDIRGKVCARHGITLTGPTFNAEVHASWLEETYGRPFGIEDGSAEDAKFIDLKLRPWWNAGSEFDANGVPKDALRIGMLLDGGGTNYSERLIVDRIDVHGTVLLQRVIGASISHVRAECPWGPTCRSWAPFVAKFACDKITVDDCDFISGCIGPNVFTDAKNPGRAGIVIDRYAAGAEVSHPKNLTLTKNRVAVSGPGIMGAAVCGGQGGVIHFENNQYDMTTAAGLSNGGRAFEMFSEMPGQRIRLRGEKSRNATGGAFKARFSGNAANKMVHLDVDNLYAWDDQLAPTTLAVFEMGPQRHYDKADVGRVTRSASVPADFIGWP